MPGSKSCFSSTESCGSTTASCILETTIGQRPVPATSACGARPAVPACSSPVPRTFSNPDAQATPRNPQSVSPRLSFYGTTGGPDCPSTRVLKLNVNDSFFVKNAAGRRFAVPYRRASAPCDGRQNRQDHSGKRALTATGG